MKPNDPHAPKDNARLMMAIIISLLVLVGFEFFVAKPHEKQVLEHRQEQRAEAVQRGDTKAAINNEGEKVKTRPEALAAATRLPIHGKRVSGSLSLKGARFDDITLNEHYTTVENVEHVALLSPATTPMGYWVDNGWLSDDSAVKLPNDDTVWQVKAGSPSEITTGGKPVELTWDNGQGVTFGRSIALDDNYMFTMTQSVENNGSTTLKLNPYHTTARNSKPVDFKGVYTLHEGPIGYMAQKEYHPSYKDLCKDDKTDVSDVSGWLGITDKYWMVAVLPEPDQKFNGRIIGSCNKATGAEHYQADIVNVDTAVQPGKTYTETARLYAGVKEYPVMKAYEEKLGIFDLHNGLDFGIYYFITTPFFIVLHMIMAALTKYGFGVYGIGMSILIMTVVVRALVFPLASKSFRSMARMRVVAPQLKALQEKYKDGDKTTLQMEIFELYKKENVNPFSGCWPIFIQIPIIFALYKVILISVELRHAPFWGWIKDLSASDPTSVFNLFGMIPWQPPAPLMIGAWPALFCLTMVLQKRITPPMPDAAQERLQTYFPFIATIMMSQFASGLIIYWTWSNVLSLFQQYYILNKYGEHKTSIIRGHSERRKKKEEGKKA